MQITNALHHACTGLYSTALPCNLIAVNFENGDPAQPSYIFIKNILHLLKMFLM